MAAGEIIEYFDLRYKALHLEYSRADSICISFPKCGRTWVRYVLGHYLHLQYGVEDTHVLNTIKRKWKKRKKLNCPLISFTHDNHSFVNEQTIKRIDLSIDSGFMFEKIFKKKKLIFLLRDPIDASVSYYKMCTNITKSFNGSIEEWFEHPMFGIDAIVKWYQTAINLYNNHKKSIVVCYEELKQGTNKWYTLIDFITEKPINHAYLEQSLDRMNFEKKKKEEMENKKIVDPYNNALFVRKGGKNYQTELPQQIQNSINNHKQLCEIRKCVASMASPNKTLN